MANSMFSEMMEAADARQAAIDGGLVYDVPTGCYRDGRGLYYRRDGSLFIPVLAGRPVGNNLASPARPDDRYAK